MVDLTKKIYDGAPEDFCWVGFGSGSGTNIRECSYVIPPCLVFSDRPSAGILSLDELKDVPKLVLDGFKFCGSRKHSGYEQKCVEFNDVLLKKLKDFEKRYRSIDLIVLGGYMRLIKDPLLSEYKDKIINVHPADLSILDETNDRMFVGANAVYDSVVAKEKSTRSSVIIVDSLVDHGEILVQGPKLAVWDGVLQENIEEDLLRSYATLHQQVQKRQSDWPALTLTLDLISKGELSLGHEKIFFDEWRGVYFRGSQLDFKGLDMDNY